MAEIVGIFSASHTPVMLNFPDAIAPAVRDDVFAAFRSVGEAISALKPDAMIVFSTDHLHNFFLNNFPAFCIGAAESYESPIEHWLKARKRTLPGESALGAFLLNRSFEAGFDPSFSMELVLDHGALTPLELAGIDEKVPIVPIMINCVQPPMPTMRRCFDFGRMLGEAIRAYESRARIVVLATGGISHDIATPRMGMVNEEFDRQLLRLMEQGDTDAVIRHATDFVHTAGNGAEEIRMWMAAMGAARGARFETLYYRAVHDWYTGIGLGRWAA